MAQQFIGKVVINYSFGKGKSVRTGIERVP